MAISNKFSSRVPWKEKLKKPIEPRIVTIPTHLEKIWGKGNMFIATPAIIDEEVKKVKKGQLITVRQIRDILSDRYGTDTTCPLTTGIFLRIVAEAAEEARNEGKSKITPYWRVIKEDGSLFEKFPGGKAHQAKLLAAEGHKIIKNKVFLESK